MLAEVTRRQKLFSVYPALLESQDGELYHFYGKKASKLGIKHNIYPKYCTPQASVFTSVKRLETAMVENSSTFFAYSARDKYLTVESGDRVRAVSFELSVFNLLKKASNIKLVIRPENYFAIYQNFENFSHMKGIKMLYNIIRY